MGAGIFPAGVGRAGSNPVQAPSPQYTAPFYGGLVAAVPGTYPLVLEYVPSPQGGPGFVQNTNGTLSGVHPVDQQVALALFIELGSIPSAPEIGSKLRTVLSRTDPQQAYQTALDEVNRALALLYAQKAITLLSFALDQSTPGRSILAIGYTNLLDPRYNPNNPALSNTGSVGVAGNRTLTGSA